MTHAFRYCSYYCEENAWHLCAEPALGDGAREVAVISNARRQVAVWCQKASPTGGRTPVVWDYHVIVAVAGERGVRVWDLDSTLGLDLDAPSYLDATFRPVRPEFRASFRVMSADVYRAVLATDRRHMREACGTYRIPPPPWPNIGEGHNLDQILDMNDTSWGEILDIAALRRRWYPAGRDGAEGFDPAVCLRSSSS